MSRIIYTKYSNDRSEKFRVRTDILKKDDGKCYVRKSAQSKEARLHLTKTIENYDLLKKGLEKTCFKVNHCTRINEDVLEFEYLHGTPLDEKLDQCLHCDDIPGFLSLIDQYKEQMELAAEDDFAITEGFKLVFGDQPLDRGQKALTVANIDQIFQNILVDGNDWHVYDYEWTFCFPVPLKYIYYRCALFYGEFDRKQYLQDRVNLFKYFGITNQEQRIFASMEEQFQAYTQQGNTPLWDIYKLISPNNYVTEALINEKQIENMASRITVRRVYENGENDELSFHCPQNEKGQTVFEVPLPAGLQTMQIMPAQIPCMVIVHAIIASGMGAEAKDYLTNGIDMGGGLFCYPAGNPGIWMDQFKGQHNTLHVELTVSLMDNAIITACSNLGLQNAKRLAMLEHENAGLKAENSNLQNINGQLQTENGGLKAEVQQLHEDVSIYKNNYETLRNSFCWRMTKPLRKILDLIKGIKHVGE